MKQNNAVAQNFKVALRKLPTCPMGGYDPWQHKTVEDLLFLAQHELDLDAEGEIDLTAKEHKAISNYMRLCEQLNSHEHPTGQVFPGTEGIDFSKSSRKVVR